MKCKDNWEFHKEFEWPLADKAVLIEFRCVPRNRIDIRHVVFQKGTKLNANG